MRSAFYLFGDRISTFSAQRRLLPVANFTSGAEFRDYFAAHYGPTIAAYRNIADDPGLTAALDRVLVDLANDHGVTSGISTGNTCSPSQKSPDCSSSRQLRDALSPLRGQSGAPGWA